MFAEDCARKITLFKTDIDFSVIYECVEIFYSLYEIIHLNIFFYLFQKNGALNRNISSRLDL